MSSGLKISGDMKTLNHTNPPPPPPPPRANQRDTTASGFLSNFLAPEQGNVWLVWLGILHCILWLVQAINFPQERNVRCQSYQSFFPGKSEKGKNSEPISFPDPVCTTTPTRRTDHTHKHNFSVRSRSSSQPF